MNEQTSEAELYEKLLSVSEAFNYHAKLTAGRHNAKHFLFSEIAKSLFYYSEKLRREQERNFGEGSE